MDGQDGDADDGGKLYFHPSAKRAQAASATTAPEFDPRDPLAVLPDPTDGSRKRRREDAGGREELPGVRGNRCDVLRDDQLAQWLHSEQHLQPWMGNDELLVDRYDVRLLVEDADQIKKLKAFALRAPADETEELRQKLDAERYRDLDVAAGGMQKPEQPLSAETAVPHAAARAGAAVGFAYSSSSSSSASAAGAGSTSELEDKTREIIHRTASFVCSQPEGVPRTIDKLKFKNVHNRSEPSSTRTTTACALAPLQFNFVLTRARGRRLHRTFDFLLLDHPHHAHFRSAVEAEQAKQQRQQQDAAAAAAAAAAALPGMAAYSDSDTSDGEESADQDSSTTKLTAPLGIPVTAATLAQVNPPKGVALPGDPTVLAMLAKLLEYRRTFTGASWPGFLAQLQQQESARSGPDRFTFLSPNSAHYDFWVWAVKAVKAVS
jgi:hypothetical protein